MDIVPEVHLRYEHRKMDLDGDGELDPQSFGIRAFASFKTITKSILSALPAAAAWLIVALLRVSYFYYV